jgi:hypothetical protein
MTLGQGRARRTGPPSSPAARGRGEVVLAHRFRLPSGLRRFAHRSTSARFQTRVARRRATGSGKSGSPVIRIAFRRVVRRSSATSARPRRFLPSTAIPSKMVSQRLDRLCRVRRHQSFSRGPCAREAGALRRARPSRSTTAFLQGWRCRPWCWSCRAASRCAMGVRSAFRPKRQRAATPSARQLRELHLGRDRP